MGDQSTIDVVLPLHEPVAFASHQIPGGTHGSTSSEDFTHRIKSLHQAERSLSKKN